MQKSRAKTCTKQSHLNALNYSSHSLTYITAAIQIHSASMNKEGGGGGILSGDYNTIYPTHHADCCRGKETFQHYEC